MPRARQLLAAVIVCLMSSPGLGGLVVTSYNTIAQTNGYAPVSQTQYFAQQTLENVSPATAEVFGDWTGPNADATPDTWHYVGTAQAATTTTISSDTYRVEGTASATCLLDTTAGFVDPTGASTYAPGGNAQYNGYFETDTPLTYSIAVQLTERSRVRLVRFGGPEIFAETNFTTVPRYVNLTGTLFPGQYAFLAATGPSFGNLNNGVHHIERTGSLENLTFTVRIPEPGVFGVLTAILVALAPDRRR